MPAKRPNISREICQNKIYGISKPCAGHVCLPHINQYVVYLVSQKQTSKKVFANYSGFWFVPSICVCRILE